MGRLGKPEGNVRTYFALRSGGERNKKKGPTRFPGGRTSNPATAFRRRQAWKKPYWFVRGEKQNKGFEKVGLEKERRTTNDCILVGVVANGGVNTIPRLG